MNVAQHDWWIDPVQYRRHEQRRGRRHAFETLTPARTALIVIDMVPFFLDANGYTRGIVPNVNQLASSVRSAGGAVAWVVPSPAAPSPARLEFLGAEVAETYRLSGGEGAPRQRIAASLDVAGTDLCVEKSTPSAFFPGASTLHRELTLGEIGTVLLAGTVANVCVESSARDASALGYRTVVVADAVSAGCDADLNAMLLTTYRSFGDVRSTADVIELISSSE